MLGQKNTLNMASTVAEITTTIVLGIFKNEGKVGYRRWFNINHH